MNHFPFIAPQIRAGGTNTESRNARYEVKLKQQLGSQPIEKIDPGGGGHMDGIGHGDENLHTNQQQNDQFVNNTLQLLDYLSSLIINSNATSSVQSDSMDLNSSSIPIIVANIPSRQTTVTPSFYQPTSTITSFDVFFCFTRVPR